MAEIIHAGALIATGAFAVLLAQAIREQIR